MSAKTHFDTRQSRVDAMLDSVDAALVDDLVPVGIFNDEDIFRAEIERIFTKSWIFVAHATEIPNPGDYVTRRIGLDPVIVSRDDEGGVNVMSSYCRHRGTEVCQTDRGNTRFFKCPYHGWTYKSNGDFAGAPLLKEAYGGRLDAKKWGLVHAPHVDTHQGLIFASLDENAPSLREYLGGAAWMLDALVGMHPDGMRVIGPPDRYRVRANWKTAAENYSGDTYHVGWTHNSAERVGIAINLNAASRIGHSYEMGEGHNFAGQDWSMNIHPDFVGWGYPPEQFSKFDLSRLDKTQQWVVTKAPPVVGTIFPNLSFARFLGGTNMQEPPGVFTSFRQWQPVGPGEFELVSWQLAWNFMSDEEVAKCYKIGQFGFGSAGLFEQDDTVNWEGIAKAGASPWLRQKGIAFNFQQGHNTAIDHSPDKDWRGPGTHRSTSYGEHLQLAFYRHWLKVMRAGAK
jgi:nitrite reductase/ring-hydroxylating ferredoxin subunit